MVRLKDGVSLPELVTRCNNVAVVLAVRLTCTVYTCAFLLSVLVTFIATLRIFVFGTRQPREIRSGLFTGSPFKVIPAKGLTAASENMTDGVFTLCLSTYEVTLLSNNGVRTPELGNRAESAAFWFHARST